MMDNFRVDITSEGDILPALKMIFGRHKVDAYKFNGSQLLLAWTKPASMEGWTSTMWQMDADEFSAIAQGWLKNVAQFPPEPDHDGHNKKGWRVYNERWGHVAGDWRIFAAIEPVWAMYGK